MSLSIAANSPPPKGKRDVPRKKKFTEVTPARFSPGTFARIDAVLGATEDRADLIRHAVEVEVAKREREAKRAAKDGGGND
jgi:hypothetical protein